MYNSFVQNKIIIADFFIYIQFHLSSDPGLMDPGRSEFLQKLHLYLSLHQSETK